MITIYGRDNCSFCVKAKELASFYNLRYEWYDITEPRILENLKNLLPEVKTVPQIFRGEIYVGGYTEFAQYIEDTIGGYGEQQI